MRIALCDDEPRYRRLMHEKILQDGFAHDYEVEVKEYGSGEELLEAVGRGENADVFFWMCRWNREGTTVFAWAGNCADRGKMG